MKRILPGTPMRCFVIMFLFLLTAGCSTLTKVENDSPLTGITVPDNLAAVLSGPQPITTDFADARLDDSISNTFGNNLIAAPLDMQPRNTDGSYILMPGFYEMTCKSYCLHAGTSGPSAGDGYLYAPLKGEKTDIIQAIIRSYHAKPNIPQSTVQLLIWAVLAKTDFKNLSPDLKAASLQLLSAQQLLELNGGALGFIPPAIINQAISSLPAPVQQVITAENNMRQLFSNTNATYQDFEHIAITSDMTNAQVYLSGSWSKHPDGYYVRYFPSSYSITRVQVYVPGNAPIISNTGKSGGYLYYRPPYINMPVRYDAAGNVAVPANTGAQRLQQSNDDAGNNDAGDNYDPCTPPDNTNPTDTDPHRDALYPTYEPILDLKKQIATQNNWNPNTTGFNTPDDAARAAIFYIDATSVKQNIEYAGNIYQNPNTGQYYFSAPVSTTENQENSSQPADSPIPAGCQRVGIYHTHAGNFANSDEHFSQQDIFIDHAQNLVSYLGTPRGKVLKFTPNQTPTQPCKAAEGLGTIEVIGY